MHPMVNIAVKAARNGSKIILRAVDRLDTLNITAKTRNDFVTQVDTLTEQEIINTIQKAYPQHTILAEESGTHEGNQDHVWIIDPLDGTANFIHGFPHFAISIAFKHKGRIEHGVIYDPIRDELFTASRGEGAHLNGRRIRVSECKKIESALIGTGFPFKNPEFQSPYLESFRQVLCQVSDIRRSGSAALDLAYVAAARLDGYWEIALKEWDIAAGSLLVREAGGLVSDFHAGDNFLTTGNIVAGNPKIFKGILMATASALKHLN